MADGDGDRTGEAAAAGRERAGKPRDTRAERLAAQLKANLKRRKEQARGRAANGEEAG